MSRSGYIEDADEPGEFNLWRGRVKSAMRGKRGQAFLREMAAALDAMPVKELIADELVTEEGQCCAIGSVALARKIDVADIEPTDHECIANTFGIAECMTQEIEYQNDEAGPWKGETPAQRWQRMREWVAKQIHGSEDVQSEGSEK